MPDGTPKRKIYDSVFCDLFQDPQYQLEIYKTLHPEDKTVTINDIKDVTLETVFLDEMYNDLGFTVRSTRIMLLEAMSTWSRNITIRSFFYLGDSYLRYLHQTKQNYYKDKPVNLPKPEVYMLYTGTEKHDERELSLAKTYWGGDDSVLDLKVKVLYGEENKNVVANSVLSQYVKFTQIFNKNRAGYGNTREAIIQTLKECKEQDVLKSYIEAHEAEVISIMMALYDKEIYMKMHDADKEDEGAFKMLVNLVKKKKMTMQGAAEEANMTISDFAERAGMPVPQA